MIKFFRNIRKALLAEGKLGKYLFYAFGEVLLVVIGILLALQINAKYEASKKEKLKNVYIDRLVNDLKLDTLNINTTTAAVAKSQVAIEEFIASLNTDTAQDTLYEVTSEFFDIGWIINDYTATDNTYKDLSQTGNMNIIGDPELIEALIKYYGFTNLLKEYHQVNKDWITPLDQQVALKTSAFEIDGATKELFSHTTAAETLNELRSEVKLLERCAAGHFWINGSLTRNMAVIKVEAIKLLELLNRE